VARTVVLAHFNLSKETQTDDSHQFRLLMGLSLRERYRDKYLNKPDNSHTRPELLCSVSSSVLLTDWPSQQIQTCIRNCHEGRQGQFAQSYCRRLENTASKSSSIVG
jgi:hypothetical protein